MPETDLALLEAAAREAGEIARRFWREDPQVWDKGGDDPVSEADFAVDSHLKTRLMAARPDYGWVSEETEDDPARLAAESVFIVDPIDGTRSFVAGERTWAHSLAVVRNGAPASACVYLPVLDKLYVAASGAGAKLNGTPIRAADPGEIGAATILAPRVATQPQFWKPPAPAFERHFRPSLAYRLALVAEGRFDAMLTLRPAWEWDIAAGVLIVTEAGGVATDRRGGALSFNTPSRQTAGAVAAGPDLHRRLIGALA